MYVLKKFDLSAYFDELDTEGLIYRDSMNIYISYISTSLSVFYSNTVFFFFFPKFMPELKLTADDTSTTQAVPRKSTNVDCLNYNYNFVVFYCHLVL